MLVLDFHVFRLVFYKLNVSWLLVYPADDSFYGGLHNLLNVFLVSSSRFLSIYTLTSLS